MAAIITKQGDTLALGVSDQTTDLSGVSAIEAAVRLGSFYRVLTVTDIDTDAGTYTILSDGLTSGWPIGSHDCDIKYTFPEGVSRSWTFQININRSVTQ